MRRITEIAGDLYLRMSTPDLEPDLHKRYRGRVVGAGICLFATVYFLIYQVVRTWHETLSTRVYAWVVCGLAVASQVALVRVAYSALRELESSPAGE